MRNKIRKAFCFVSTTLYNKMSVRHRISGSRCFLSDSGLQSRPTKYGSDVDHYYIMPTNYWLLGHGTYSTLRICQVFHTVIW